MSLPNVLFFALLALASAAASKESLDAHLHALSAKVKEQVDKVHEETCTSTVPECMDWCHHEQEKTWEDKCADKFHCCSGCPRCVETENLLPATFLLESKVGHGWCVYPEGGNVRDEVSLIWHSDCDTTDASLKLKPLDAGNGYVVLQNVAASEYCVHPSQHYATVANGVPLVWYNDCSLDKPSTQFKPVWYGDNFMLLSVEDNDFCVQSSGGTVANDVGLVFHRGCDLAAQHSKFEAVEV
jgi:hypothetical protein